MIDRRRRIKTNIQVEMVEKGLRLYETSAGQQVSQDLINTKLKHDKDLDGLQNQHEAALHSNNDAAAKQLLQMKEKLSAEIDEAKRARTKLETTVAQLQVKKKEEMVRTEERLKQQFMKVNE
ncbi:hypothetical protein EV127DRAFT_408620 [Xylaria flabelliformis]|nr:hypothetical protein EV127DRAFT_408620 [Xylaria flabelliformis]